jgi:hypothetical protein
MKVIVNWDIIAKPHFQFLDLPAELRIMVYERLPVKIQHHTFSHRAVYDNEDYWDYNGSEPGDDSDIDVTLVVKSLPMALLATCKQINDEASRHMKPALEQLRSELMRLIVDTGSFSRLFQPQDFFRTAMQHCLTRLELAKTGPFITRYKVQGIVPPAMRRSIKRTSSDSRRLEKCQELTAFVRKCASLVHCRTAASSIIALTRCNSDENGLREIVGDLAFTTGAWDHRHPFTQGPLLLPQLYPDHYYGSWNVLPGPVGFMFREAMCDQFDDPPTAKFPNGPYRTAFRKEASESSFGPARFLVEDVNDEEWARDWDESDGGELGEYDAE